MLTIGYNSGPAISPVSMEYMKANFLFSYNSRWKQMKNLDRYLSTQTNVCYDAILDAIFEISLNIIAQSVHEVTFNLGVYSYVFMGKEYNASISNSEIKTKLFFPPYRIFVQTWLSSWIHEVDLLLWCLPLCLPHLVE